VRATGVLIGALAALAVTAPAHGHHSLMVNEVAASAGSSSDFVELQMYRQGQNGVAGTTLDVYNSLGAKQSFTLASEPPNGRDQSTILFGAGGVAGADFTFAALGPALEPAGGAVCFSEATPPDCVGWGTFTAAPSLPFPGAGPLAPAIPEGLSLARTHARGCATSLDAPDDTNSSAADLSLGTPTPRPNSATPTEFECVPCGGVTATIVGTDAKETLTGTAGPDVIAAKAGADTVIGLGGDDVLCGEIGKDVLKGGAGRDRLIGGRGRDACPGARKDLRRSCEAPKRH
jgi:hypothetical protein